MSLDTSGIDQLRLQLKRLAGVSLVANAELRKCADEMKELAIKMAPVDEGNLEKAIKVRYVGEQGAGGRFAKGGGAYEVYIDNSLFVPGRKNGETVGMYAWEMHEHLTPYGDYNLGKKSQDKQASDGSVIVGGKFIERAGEAYRQLIPLRIGKVVFKYVEALDIE